MNLRFGDGMTSNTSVQVARMRTIAFLIAMIGIIGCVIGWIFSPHQFFVSYLTSFLVWFGLSAGSLLWLMIHYLTGGRWGNPLRRLLEAAAETLSLLVLLFVPILFGLRELYPWMNSAALAANEVLRHKHLYLNPPGFIVRAAIFFALWIWIANLFRNWSHQQDTRSDFQPTQKLRKLSGPGLILYPITATFVYVDWIMSLEADWYSTLFPILICIGQMLGALAFMTVLLAWLAPVTSLASITSRENFRHLGSLLLAFTMMWAYLAFAQFLIVWSGDLPHEISWYLHRSRGGWGWIVTVLFLFHFSVPFFLLLSRRTKGSVIALTCVAAALFVAHVFDIWWMVTPSFYATLHLSWLDLVAFLGIGGIWFATFSWFLTARPLLPINDPRFAVAAA
jgi:hypothetical protein